MRTRLSFKTHALLRQESEVSSRIVELRKLRKAFVLGEEKIRLSRLRVLHGEGCWKASTADSKTPKLPLDCRSSLSAMQLVRRMVVLAYKRRNSWPEQAKEKKHSSIDLASFISTRRDE